MKKTDGLNNNQSVAVKKWIVISAVGLLIILATVFFTGRPFYTKYKIKNHLAGKNIECSTDGLLNAISNQDLESAEKLLLWGVIASDHGSLNQIPIMEAAKKGDVPMVKLLLSHGADAESKDFKNRTVLWHLTHAPYTDELYSGVIELLEAGTDVNREYTDGWNPIIWASQRGAVHVVEKLIAHGASTESRDKEGRTPLIFAIRRGQLDLAQSLVTHGADLNVIDSKGRFLLWHAGQSSKRNFELIKFLIKSGIDVKGPFTGNWKPLNWAAYFDEAEILTLLIDKGVGLNEVDSDGNSALMIAAMNGHIKSAELLMTAGSDPKLINKEGKSALDLVPRNVDVWTQLLSPL